MDISTVLMLAAAAVAGAAGLWLTAMAMQGSAPARVEAKRDQRD